jgi:hypothetical protein
MHAERLIKTLRTVPVSMGTNYGMHQNTWSSGATLRRVVKDSLEKPNTVAAVCRPVVRYTLTAR